MKPTTTKILSLLNDEAAKVQMESLLISNANVEIQETTVEEAINLYKGIKQSLYDAIEKGILDQLTYSVRHRIETSVNRIQSYTSNPNQLVPEVLKLSEEMDSSNIYELLSKTYNRQVEAKELSKLRAEYKDVLNQISTAKQILAQANEYHADISAIVEDIDNQDVSNKLKSVITHADEINAKRDELIAFAANIEKSKETLVAIQEDLTDRIDKEITAGIIKSKELIEQAEKALELKETEGMAKAISSRLSTLTASNAPGYWIAGASIFVVITLVFAYLLAGGYIGIFHYESNGSVGAIIGRIVVTVIGISGATFCAGQYNKLRNLQEDYEYKVVLSKSILAFANKIKEFDQKDGSKLSEYLTKVLNEIHQDPLRSHKQEASKDINPDVLQKVIDFAQSFKK